MFTKDANFVHKICDFSLCALHFALAGTIMEGPSGRQRARTHIFRWRDPPMFCHTGRPVRFRGLRLLTAALLLGAALAGCAGPAGGQPGQEPAPPDVPDSVTVPILLYHDVSEDGVGEYVIARENLYAHLDALQEAGYQTVTFAQLAAYVKEGEPLPDKPVVLTFDDGYLSNYEVVWPALLERDMTATIFAIGVSVGKDTYKDTGAAMTPHFSYAQAEEMIQSGAVSVQSHTFDMHQYQPLEADGGRRGCLPREGETEEDYRLALEADLTRAIDERESNTSETALVLSYPGGDYTPEAEEISAALGMEMSVSTAAQPALLRRGDPASLRLMGRYNIDDCSAQELLDLLASACAPAEAGDGSGGEAVQNP